MKKTTFKKVLALVLCAALTVGVLAGCGGKEEPEDTTPVNDPKLAGKLLICCDAMVEVSYDGRGLVTKLEGTNEKGATVVGQYDKDYYTSEACAKVVCEVLLKCDNNGYLPKEKGNIVIKQIHGSGMPNAQFLENIQKEAEAASTVDAAIWVIPATTLDEQGYINAETAKSLLQTHLGVDSLDKISPISELTDGQYNFMALVGGRRNTYAVDAVTGQVTDIQVQEPDYEHYYEEVPDTNPDFIETLPDDSYEEEIPAPPVEEPAV